MPTFLRAAVVASFVCVGCDQVREAADSAQRQAADLTASSTPPAAAPPIVAPAIASAAPVESTPVVPPPAEDPAKRVQQFLSLPPEARSDAVLLSVAKLPAEALAPIDEVKIASSQVTEVGLEVLTAFPGLKRLTLQRMPFTPAMAKVVARLHGLEELSLEGAELTDDSVLELSPLAELKTLNLKLTAVTDAGAKVIPQLAGLETLNLGTTKVSGASFLKAPPSRLRVLDVTDSDFGVGLAWLKGLDTLEELRAAGTRVDDKVLLQAGGWPNLRTLSFDGCNGVTDAGVAVALKTSRKLVDVNLSQTGISNRTLGMLQHCKSLEQLTVLETKVNDAGGAALKKILPNAKIAW